MTPPLRTCGLLGMIALTVLVPAGCGAGDDLPREPISGTVTFKGEPVKSGTIQFVPMAGREGVSSGGIITDGSFQVAREDGPIPGTYSVMIFAGDRPRPATKDGVMPGDEPRAEGKPALSVGLIPMRFNLKTELTAEVKPGGPNAYTFDLKP
jgi:hypothetical protein